MGQHKHNPTAIAAAKGELPPTLRRWCVANTVDTLGHPFLADATIAKKYMLPYCRPDDFCSHGEYQTNTGGSNNVAD
jgi:hypothetical protein